MSALDAPVNLTSELVDEMLESSRLQIERELAQAGPLAVNALSEIMQKTDARDSDRISAASKILDKVMAPPKAETPEHRGPTIHITINKLSTGRRESIPLPVSEKVMDAIEAGIKPIEGLDFDDDAR